MGIEQINVFKKEKGLTNKQLSELSGVPKSTIDKITSGLTKDPSLDTIKALVSALGKSLNDIDDVEENEENGEDIFKSKFIENIILCRKSKGIKQSEMAEMLGKTLNTIVNWENGSKEVDVESIAKLCKIFSIDANTLLGWSEKQLSSSGISRETGHYVEHTAPEQLKRLTAFFAEQEKKPSLDSLIEIIKMLPDEAYNEAKNYLLYLKFIYKEADK